MGRGAVAQAQLAVLRPLNAAVRDLTRSRWSLARAYGQLSAHAKLRLRPSPVLVYQMGKVASETVARSLRQHDDLARRGVLHIHFFDEAALREEESRLRSNWPCDIRTGTHIFESRSLRRRLRDDTDERPWDVITLVRDPVARNLSSFFHVLDDHFGVDLARPPSLEQLSELFYERFDTHDTPLTWFDTELRPTFGIDVYEAPFEPSVGYAHYESERARVLLMRAEDLDRVAGEAVPGFLGLPSFTLANKNVGDAKPYGDLYQRFQREVGHDDAYLDRMYGSRYARHFYTDAELDGFRRRWG